MEFMIDIYCEDNSGFVKGNRMGESSVENIVEPCWAFGRAFEMSQDQYGYLFCSNYCV